LTATILILPTRPSIETAWGRYRLLCIELAEAPARADDPNFMARVAAAREEWQLGFAAWAEATCR